MAIEREVIMRLGVESTAGAGRAFTDLDKQAKKLEDTANRAGKAVRNVGSGGAGGSGQAMGGGGQFGGFGGNGGGSGGGIGGMMGGRMGSAINGAVAVIAGATLAFKGVEAAAHKMAESGNVFNNETLTAIDANKQLAAAWIPGAKAMQEFVEALKDMPGQLRRMKTSFERLSAFAAANDARQTRINEANTPLRDARAQHEADSEIVRMIQGDRSLQKDLADEHTGMQAHRELEAVREKLAAENRAGNAAMQESLARHEAAKAEKRVDSAISGLKPNDEIRTDEDKLEQTLKLLDVNRALADEKRALDRLEKMQANSMRTTVEYARAAADVERGGVRLKMEKIRLLAEEEQKAKGMAEAYGGLSRNERALANLSARQLQTGGIDTLSEGQKGLLQKSGIFGDLYKQKSIESAQNDPLFKEALGLSGQRDIQTIMKEKAQLQMQVSNQIYLNEKELASQIVKQLEPAVKAAESTAQRIAANERNKFEAERRAANIQQK